MRNAEWLAATRSGKIHWQERLGSHYSSSLVSTGEGLVYATDDDGETKVFRPGEKLEVIVENKLGEEVYASMALSDGQIYIRGMKHLWCVGKK